MNRKQWSKVLKSSRMLHIAMVFALLLLCTVAYQEYQDTFPAQTTVSNSAECVFYGANMPVTYGEECAPITQQTLD